MAETPRQKRNAAIVSHGATPPEAPLQGLNGASGTDSGEKVSLAPLGLREALAGLLAIPDPDATKPKHEKERRRAGKR
jgi:hypothetical protein